MFPPFASVEAIEAPAEVTASATPVLPTAFAMSFATVGEPVCTTALTVAFLSAVSKSTPLATCTAVLARAVPTAELTPN